MSVNREGQLIQFCCDECSEELEIASRDFKDAWEVAKLDHGWRCFTDENDEWVHRCAACRGI